MLKIYPMPLGAYQTNTYIVANDGRCVVIDPGYEPETINRFLLKNSLTADAIFLTHGHFDHVGALNALAETLNCPVYIHAAELSLPPITIMQSDSAARWAASFCRDSVTLHIVSKINAFVYSFLKIF
jgi:glyoxylase-like metal-dependent hydrolase (beta-lactamase superfamily II)